MTVLIQVGSEGLWSKGRDRDHRTQSKIGGRMFQIGKPGHSPGCWPAGPGRGSPNEQQAGVGSWLLKGDLELGHGV